MQTFKQFITEGGKVPVVSTQREVNADLNEPRVIDELNRFLAQVTSVGFVNPYSGLAAISKTLSTYGLMVPQVTYLPEPNGEEVFEIQQWGVHPGYDTRMNTTKDGIQTNSGIIPYRDTKNEEVDPNFYVYFCWDMNVNGTYDCFCMLVDNEGLETITAQEEYEENGEELQEISKSTLRSYLDKSKGPDYPDEKTFRKRVSGGAMAMKKLGMRLPHRSGEKVKIKAR